MSKEGSIVDGFEFADYEEAVQAAKETEGICYIRSRLNTENPHMVLQMYNKMVSQKLFGTAVGYSFLKELQNYLYDSPVISDAEIIPIQVVQHEACPARLSEEDIPKKEEEPEKSAPKKPSKVTEKTRESDRIICKKYKQRCIILSFVCMTLAVSVTAMFILSATGKNMTILNYENTLIDKYEAWEQELEQREAAVKERERQLGQD